MKHLLLFITLSLISCDSLWRRSTLYIGADDSLYKIYINENEIDISSLENKEQYDKVKKIELTLFNYDEIKIYVKNFRELTRDDNAGLAVKLDYKDQYGNDKLLYTNLNDWECNGEKPIDKKIVGNNHYPTWNVQGLNDVNVIWAEGNPKEAYCRFVVPKIQE